MADPVASVEKIVKLGLAIKKAVDKVRHNEVECNDIRRRVLRFSAILSQLQRTGMMNDSPAMSGAMEDLEETLQHALELVTACQERTTVRRLLTAGELSKNLRRVKDDILNKVMLASFAINTHTSILLLSLHQAAGHPPLRQPEDTAVTETLHNIHSTDDDNRCEFNCERSNVIAASLKSPFVPILALRKFKSSELEDATSNFSHENIIGKGGDSLVYKGILNDGSVVAIKKFVERDGINSWAQTYDIHLLVSKLQQKNIVQIVGYGTYDVPTSPPSSSLICFLKHKRRVLKRKYFWVEEYAPNGSLDKMIHLSQLDWSSIFRIIEGVALGLLCLHEQSIIHLDIKPGNIVLDSDMNPKIIDFGVSVLKSYNGNTDAYVIRRDIIRGTLGYIPPEYLANSTVSMENDVFAFGMTLLDTVGSLVRSKPPGGSNIWAWEARESGGMDELFDRTLLNESQLMEIKMCVEVALLCTQEAPRNRPTMSDVLQMLRGLKELWTPVKPAWCMDRAEWIIDSTRYLRSWSDVSPR